MFANTKSLRTAVTKPYLATGHGFSAANGGGRQNKYRCSGAAIVQKLKRKLGDDDDALPQALVTPPEVSAATPCCTSEVRATLSRVQEWRVTYADFEHVNCAGGTARGRLCAINPLVTCTLGSNPDNTVKALRQP